MKNENFKIRSVTLKRIRILLTTQTRSHRQTTLFGVKPNLKEVSTSATKP